MPPETDNLRLEELHAADQKDREKAYASAEDIAGLKERDRRRRDEALELIGRGEVNSPNDLYRAGVIFLHGAESKDFAAAHRLAVVAAIQGHKGARWLSAASLDRLLMSVDLPQSYGTQFEYSDEERGYRLRLPIDDSAVLHFEKRFFGVPSVIERLTQLNKRAQN